MLLEWLLDLPFGAKIHQSILARFAILLPAVVVAALLYQATNASIYYIIGLGLYTWGYY